MSSPAPTAATDAEFSLAIEPVNLCNLACSYCLRDDAQLHADPAKYLSVDLLRRVLREAKDTCGASLVSMTGGEPTLHPRFGEILDTISQQGYRFVLVTNGWHFGRVRPSLVRNRAALSLVAFSIDGATEASHDQIRGKGSFRRLMSAVADCHAAGLPFSFKVVLHRQNSDRVEAVALFAARMGARSVKFAHLLPTSPATEREMALSPVGREAIENEIATLQRILRIDIVFAAGYTNRDPAPPCRVLALNECNIDYAGRMSMCCNLSGFRGGVPSLDGLADLNVTSFAEAWAGVTRHVALQNDRRRLALEGAGPNASFRVTSPCELCLTHFKKRPWLRETAALAESAQ